MTVVSIEEFRIGNIVSIMGEEFPLTENRFLRVLNKQYEVDAVTLTREKLKQFGFEITDLGDFWQCQKEDFILIQLKLSIIPGKELPFTFVLKSSIEEVLNISTVHHLQNLYYDLKGKALTYQTQPSV